MNVREGMEQMFYYIRESEECSCPYITMKDGKPILKLFTYFASTDEPMEIYGYGSLLSYDGEKVTVERKGLFQQREEIITIYDMPMVTWEKQEKLIDAYYDALQRYIKSQNFWTLRALAKAFYNIVPQDAIELYWRICPEFIQMLPV